MNPRPLSQIIMRWLLAFAAIFALNTCALGAPIVEHSFSFDARTDSPDVEILDFRYGNSKQPGASNPDWVLQEGKSFQQTSITGAMLRGDFLFVKWRIKNTSRVYEDTVDLRQRLPMDISGHRIYFVVKGPQLYVYLISPKKRPKDMPPNGPEMYDDLVTTTIYPDQPKP